MKRFTLASFAKTSWHVGWVIEYDVYVHDAKKICDVK